MKKNRIGKLLFVFTLLLIPCLNANAASVVTVTKCINNTLYNITYDTKVNTEVFVTKITLEDIQRGSMLPPAGTTGEDLEKYKFKVSVGTTGCYSERKDEDETTLTCPSDKNITVGKVLREYFDSKEVDVTDNIRMTLDENSGKYNVTIIDKFNKKLLIRHVVNESTENTGGQRANMYANELLSPGADGNYHIYGIEPDKNIKIEFYQAKNDECSGYYIGTLNFQTPSLDDYDVLNPIIDNPNGYGCDAVKKYVPPVSKNSSEKISGDILEAFNNDKMEYIRECYPQSKTETMKFSEKQKLSETIAEKLGALKATWEGRSYAKISGKAICQNEYQAGSRESFNWKGSYWKGSCTETLLVKGDKAKLVKAGGAFAYVSTFTVERTCTIARTGFAVMKPQCYSETDCHCNGVYRKQYYECDKSVDPSCAAGPNQDFDKCINKCDGGKYTQNCINSCYTEVYGDTKRSKKIEKFSIDSKKSNVEFTSYIIPATDLPVVRRDKTVKGYPANVYELNGVECFVSDACASNNNGCYFRVTVGPPGCSWNPQDEYDSEIARSMAEFEYLKDKLLTSDIPKGNYRYTITDSYLNKDGNYFNFVVDSNNNPALNVHESEISTSTDGCHSETLGSQGESVSFCTTNTATKTMTVSLPYSYVNRLTTEPTFKTTEDTTDAYFINTSTKKLEKVKTYNQFEYYHNSGERKYYTNVHSPNINVNYNNKTYTLKGQNEEVVNNIRVDYWGVGGAGYSSTETSGKTSEPIKCYYGVYNKFICPPPCNEDVTGSGGIQFIFRPVDLGDLFPNGRAPRWNWSCKATMKDWYTQNLYGKGTAIAPVSLTNRIEKWAKGEKDIYDPSTGEMDYEFILTGENIRNIQRYNKEIKTQHHDYNNDDEYNYLDYDMHCTNKNGISVCESQFLNDEQYVTYAGGHSTATRQSIIGCNNAMQNGTMCDKTLVTTRDDICSGGSYGNLNKDPECTNMVQVD